MLVEVVVDHHHRCAGAGREALFLLFEEDAAIGGTLTDLDAELALAVREDILAAVEPTGDVGADADMMPAARMRLEHRIEGGDLIDLYGRQPQVLGDSIHQIGREEALVLLLHEPQRRERRRTLPTRRKPGDPAVYLMAGVGGEQCDLRAVARDELLAVARADAHRSISPKTMSCVPMTATTSDNM